jgi:hypothetical protein
MLHCGNNAIAQRRRPACEYIPLRGGITADVLQSDGKPTFGNAPLAVRDPPGITWEIMDSDSAEITPAHVARYDAICAMLTRVTPASLTG